MYKIIGDKKIFAIEIELSLNKWQNRTALWLNNNRIGNWEDKNLLGPFLNSIYRISNDYESFWLAKFEGLVCKEIFLSINPYHLDSEKYNNISENEREELYQLENFKFSWGENLDLWNINVVYKNGNCKFLWVYSPNLDDDNYEIINNIKCFDVPLNIIQNIYKELCDFIPDELWPTLLPKYFK